MIELERISYIKRIVVYYAAISFVTLGPAAIIRLYANFRRQNINQYISANFMRQDSQDNLFH